ncbi:MAG: ATP-dependent zinc metalloprotease FtsH [Leptospiraceae bacterium]|nr:ATP-dependent zinc metalloprotease FtsH [Leptospiraceae bacterium]MDW7975618.1 ATP-dependent zinc metalloprotease FtsH [Leptospiraceae bacterium]
MNKGLRIIFFITGFIILLYLFQGVNQFQNFETPEPMTYSEFRKMLVNAPDAKGKIFTKNIQKNLFEENPFILKVTPTRIDGRYVGKNVDLSNETDIQKLKASTIPFYVEVLPDIINDEFIQILEKNGIIYKFENPQKGGFLNTIISILPYVFIILLLWFFMFRQIQSTGNKALAFGKSRAKLHLEGKTKVTFNDVAGCDEAKEELREVVDFLKDPKKFQNIGARIPKGVLLVGPPGTGKTLLAKAVAGEAGVPFFSISGSDFVEMFVGVGASRVRDLFEQAKKNAPCIIFIDEIDAVGRLRGAGLGGGHDEREQTLNQLLVEMDGFEENEGIIVIAATNRPDILDPALLRPGRFDRQVIVNAPDVKGREEILKIHARKVPLASDVSLAKIARGTPGFTGADLANLINEAALLAARKNKKRVTQEELEEAKDKVLMGPERRSFLITEQEKEVIAYHEAGHALLGTMLPYAEPVHKVTIIPRGRALGLTQQLPEGDKHIHPKKYWLDRICILMGGYLAEEIVFKDTSTGAANDIQVATNIARKMVCEWGMSEKLGTVSYAHEEQNIFLARDIAHVKTYSEQTAALIDAEVKRFIEEQLSRGKELLIKHRDKLDKIAKTLLEKETITGEELNEIVGYENLAPNQKRITLSQEAPKKSYPEVSNGEMEPIPAT